MARDAAIASIQNAPIKVRILYFENFSIKTCMAELGTLGNGFLGIGIVTTMISIRDNTAYSPLKRAVFNAIDKLIKQ